MWVRCGWNDDFMKKALSPKERWIPYSFRDHLEDPTIGLYYRPCGQPETTTINNKTLSKKKLTRLRQWPSLN